MPTVSIIIPTYNRAAILKETCRSVLRQSCGDFEILIIDDGSSDDTRQVIERIADPRVRYFFKENGGQSSARNKGLAEANGEYVAFLDADDLWPADYLQAMLAALDIGREYDAAYARVVARYPDGSQKNLSRPEYCRSGRLTKYFYGEAPCLIPSAILFRRSAWHGFFWDETIRKGTDYDAFLRISVKVRFLFVPDTFIIKQNMNDSLSNTPDALGPLNKAQSLERFYLHLDGNKYVSRRAASRKISHEYRKAFLISRTLGQKREAAGFLRKAIQWYPLDLRLYLHLLMPVCGRWDRQGIKS